MSRERSRAGLKNHEITLKPITKKHLPGKLTMASLFFTGSASSPLLPLTYIPCDVKKGFQIKIQDLRSITYEWTALAKVRPLQKEHTLSSQEGERGLRERWYRLKDALAYQRKDWNYNRGLSLHCYALGHYYIVALHSTTYIHYYTLLIHRTPTVKWSFM